jgi:NAD(P)-dependent dehydrogenase (short-subunit alcohol dehydrogenase family)
MVLALASQDPSTMILTARTPEKANAVAQKVKIAHPSVNIQILKLDLSSQKSVRDSAAELLRTIGKVDILINNAGVMALPERMLSEDGVEMHFATNFLGHFLFSNLILPVLSPNGRVINITSGGYGVTPIRFSDINFDGTKSLPVSEQPNYEVAAQLGLNNLEKTQGYVPFLAYLHSNTANMLFTTSLAEKLKKRGIQSFSAAPGVVVTELQRHVGGFRNPVMTYKTAGQGAATFLVAALDPGLKGLFLHRVLLCIIADYEQILLERIWMTARSLEMWDMLVIRRLLRDCGSWGRSS